MLRSAASQAGAVNRALFMGRSLNFQSTADQPLVKQFTGTLYRITDIVAVRRTGGATVACAGGIYDAAGKGGNAVVGALQSWVALASGVIVTPVLAALAGATALTGSLILSLTTGSTAAVTADVFVYGYVID